MSGKIAEFVDGSPCSFSAVIDRTYMVYFNFFGCVLLPLVVMFAIYCYIYSVVRRQIARIAAMTPSQAVVMVSVQQQQDTAVSQPSSSVRDQMTSAADSNIEEATAPTTMRGRTRGFKKHCINYLHGCS